MCQMTQQPTDIHIRPFDADDQRAVRDLILTGMSERWGRIDESANPDLDDIAQSYGSGDFLVAHRDGGLVGTGGLVRESDSTVRITRMWVAKRYRRCGIGTLMLRRLLAAAAERGYRRVVLETTDTWRDAISFYQKHRFSVEAHRDGDTHFSSEIAAQE